MKKHTIILVMCLLSTADAFNWLVPTDFPDIQAALDSPAVADGDTITVIGNPVTPIVYSGPGFRDIDFNGKLVTVQAGDAAGGYDPRSVIIDIYEELFRRLILTIFGGEEKEQEIMEKSKILLDMVSNSQGGSDSFGDFHQSNLMIRTTPQGEIVNIAIIDPTFWMQGSFDRFEDIGTFFGRQALIEYRTTNTMLSTISDIKQFIEGLKK